MSSKAILCIDDEKMILDCLRLQLKHAFNNNFTYEFAKNAAEARAIINLLAEKNIILEAVITDWLMPGMKGDDFLIEIHKTNPHVLKIILSGQIDMASVEKAKKFGGLFKHIRKPWDYEDLIETIKEGLALKD